MLRRTGPQRQNRGATDKPENYSESNFMNYNRAQRAKFSPDPKGTATDFERLQGCQRRPDSGARHSSMEKSLDLVGTSVDPSDNSIWMANGYTDQRGMQIAAGQILITRQRSQLIREVTYVH